MAISAALALPMAAFAGSNGQALIFNDQRGNVYSVCVSGYNQNLVKVSHCWATPGSSTCFGGWYWIGTVYMAEYNYTGAYLETQTTNVPKTQNLPDWMYWDLANYGESASGC